MFRSRGFYSTGVTWLRSTSLAWLGLNLLVLMTPCTRAAGQREALNLFSISVPAVIWQEFQAFPHLCYSDWRLLLLTVILCMKLFRNLNPSFYFSQCHIISRWETGVTASVQWCQMQYGFIQWHSNALCFVLCPNHSLHLIWPLLSTELIFIELSRVFEVIPVIRLPTVKLKVSKYYFLLT